MDRARAPRLAATVRALRDGGATALELGFPFSDPIADGPVLAAAADRALEHGTRWSDLFTAARIASAVLPTAVMTYANPVLRHGLPEAMRALAGAGVSGLIVPDLSLEEAGPWRAAARAHRLALVMLAAPGGSPDRVAKVARSSRGFLYLVAYYGTTGQASAGGRVDLAPLVASARRGAPGLPILIGFGVRDRPSAERALASGADGVVIGTALEEEIARGSAPTALARWLRDLVPPARS